MERDAEHADDHHRERRERVPKFGDQRGDDIVELAEVDGGGAGAPAAGLRSPQGSVGCRTGAMPRCELQCARLAGSRFSLAEAAPLCVARRARRLRARSATPAPGSAKFAEADVAAAAAAAARGGRAPARTACRPRRRGVAASPRSTPTSAVCAHSRWPAQRRARRRAARRLAAARRRRRRRAAAVGGAAGVSRLLAAPSAPRTRTPAPRRRRRPLPSRRPRRAPPAAARRARRRRAATPSHLLGFTSERADAVGADENESPAMSAAPPPAAASAGRAWGAAAPPTALAPSAAAAPRRRRPPRRARRARQRCRVG